MTALLDGIDLVIFDKDGTLIEFGPMWSGWALELAARLRRLTGRSVDEPLFAMLGFEPATRTIRHGGGLTATPMARLREQTRDLLQDDGLSRRAAEQVLADAWHAPDPVALAHPLADLPALFGGLRASGRRIAIATSDDREPTLRTLAALGIAASVAAVVCADDGLAVKPAGDMVARVCESLAVDPARTAVVGDSTADLLMGRAAGAGLVVGVLTGVGRLEDLAPHADAVIASVAELEVPGAGRRLGDPEVRLSPGRPDERRTSVAPAHEAEHEQEQVDEVEIEGEGPEDGRLLHRLRGGREVAGLDALHVVRGQDREEDHAEDRDDPGQSRCSRGRC